MPVLRIPGPIRELRERERRLVENLALERAADERLEGWLLETFDGRLFRDGGLVERREGPDATELIWTDLDLVGERGRIRPAPAPPILAPSLPAGPVGERLGELLADRALLAVGHLRRRRHTWAMRDAHGKIVLRVLVESAIEFTPAGDRPRRRLPAQIHVEGLRGYEDAFARAQALVAKWRGVEAASSPFATELLGLAGWEPGHDPSTLRYEIGPGSSAAEGFRNIFAALLDVIEVNLPGTIEALDDEFLHDLRVAIRRTRTLIASARDVIAEPSREAFAREFRWLGGETSWLRDLDVYLLHFDQFVARAPRASEHELEPLRALLRSHRERAREHVATVLRAERTRTLLRRWRAFLETEVESGAWATEPTLVPLAVDRVRRAEKRVLRLGRSIDGDSPDEEFHELRKRAKKLRYLLEFFGEVIDAEASRERIRELKDLQDLLGAHQDRAVQIAALERFGEELMDVPATRASIHALVHSLDAERRAFREDFARHFSAYDAPKVRRTFRGVLDRVAPRVRGASDDPSPKDAP